MRLVYGRKLRALFSDEVSEENLTWFIMGITLSMVLITSLNILGVVEIGHFNYVSLDNQPDKNEVGDKTVRRINDKILRPSPNDVDAHLVNVSDARDLENFYEVRVNVSNPGGSQITTIYSKKDGSLAFMQFPRTLEGDFNKYKYH